MSDPAMHSNGNGNGNGDGEGTHDHAALDGVAAHRLLGSSSVVCMGLATLLRLWKSLPDEQCLDLLGRMAEHAAAVDAGLKLLTLGHDGAEAPPRAVFADELVADP